MLGIWNVQIVLISSLVNVRLFILLYSASSVRLPNSPVVSIPKQSCILEISSPLHPNL